MHFSVGKKNCIHISVYTIKFDSIETFINCNNLLVCLFIFTENYRAALSDARCAREFEANRLEAIEIGSGGYFFLCVDIN